ncbi:putative membrane protein [Thermosporothrix hazakensis]|uniref:DUF1622 domain-containing protein n=2 Tax=Thermosporothrix TaxID=768650 RepID=A0A455SA40_9CHLR|nr:DUF1622 domain-containing protein [Thermosporothrix hazakensis]PZW28373.1 putative membrane protein [Thermosporothrix hazakensis]BBH85313.1 hypothetical protein KTC_00640 [Thermosporothrix sp. COM3]GCE46266.1 hypothetical protein KTH_11350 [Thermosporothrix hazakensis]
MEGLFKLWTSFLASGVEAVAGLIIAFAALQACIRALLIFLDRSRAAAQYEGIQAERIRLRLGRWLALALEFELGADILRTAIAPTWTEVGQLAAIAAIRTLLNYFLQQEIDRAVRRDPERAHPVQDEPASVSSVNSAIGKLKNEPD